MTSWQGSSTAQDGPEQYWRAFQISLLLVVCGGFITTAVSRISDQSCDVSIKNLNAFEVQYTLPILTLVVAFLVMATLRTNEGSSQISVSTDLLKTWCVTSLLLSLSVAFIEGLNFASRLFLGLLLTVFLLTTIVYFALLVQIAFLRPLWLFSVGLLLPGIVNAARSCTSSSSAYHEVLIQIGITSAVSVFLFGICLFQKIGITIERATPVATLFIALPVLAMALFFGAITVPVRMGDEEKIDYLISVASMRLPIFAVSTFLLLSSPIFIVAAHSSSRRVIIHRRLGVIAGIVALISLLLLGVYYPLEATTKINRELTLTIVLVSTAFAMLLPWFLLRLRENRIDKFDILALIVASSLIVAFRQSTLMWQATSLVAVVTLVVLFWVRHIFRTQRVLTQQPSTEEIIYSGSKNHLVSVVIPSFNPGAEVIRTVSRVRDELSQSSHACQIIVVSDGSTDESIQLLEDYEQIDRHIWLRTNHGKGAALREGFARCDGAIVCFIDADGDLDPSVLSSMVQMIDSNKSDIVYGSKLHPDSDVEMSFLRRTISSGFRLLVRVLFHFDVADTQTGVKAFSGDLIKRVLPLTSENGFNLDLELFVVSHALGYRRFTGHPIVLDRRGTSTVGLTTVIQMLISTLRLFRRRSLTLDYIPVESI